MKTCCFKCIVQMKSIAVFCRRCLVHTALFENIRPLPFDFTTLGNDGNSLQQSVPEGNEALPVGKCVWGERCRSNPSHSAAQACSSACLAPTNPSALVLLSEDDCSLPFFLSLFHPQFLIPSPFCKDARAVCCNDTGIV